MIKKIKINNVIFVAFGGAEIIMPGEPSDYYFPIRWKRIGHFALAAILFLVGAWLWL